MTCRNVAFPIAGGGVARGILCTRGERRRKCKACGAHGDEKLCDFDVGGGKTCDAKCCSACAQHVGDDKDYCAKHREDRVTATEKPKPKKLRPDPAADIAERVSSAIADAAMTAPIVRMKKIDAQWLADTNKLVERTLISDRNTVRNYFVDVVGKLMKSIGADEGVCSSCHRPIWWVTTKTGKKAPFDLDGLNHFASCPSASQHRS